MAYSKDVTKPSDNTLNLTFQHILTRINFAVKLVDSSYTYTVESITITGAKGGTATYTFGGTEGKGGNWNITGSAPASGYSYTFDNTVTAKDGIYDYTQNDNSLMLYPILNGEWTNGQSIRYILTLPVGAEEMSVNTTYDENWDTDNEQTLKTLHHKIPQQAYKSMKL